MKSKAKSKRISDKMATLFVTRHQGARDWAARQSIPAQIVPHLETASIVACDTIIGTLPINLVADINAKGARYLHLVMELPMEARGRDLSADEMEKFGARLVEYHAEMRP
jgi:CRISPR-associated protein Csx16